MKKLSLLICVIFLLNSVFANDVKLVSWNVETFFDAVTSGDEYKEFRSSSKWNEASYKNRLFKLVEAIKILDADVLVLIELENKEILYDISVLLTGYNSAFCSERTYLFRNTDYFFITHVFSVILTACQNTCLRYIRRHYIRIRYQTFHLIA